MRNKFKKVLVEGTKERKTNFKMSEPPKLNPTIRRYIPKTVNEESTAYKYNHFYYFSSAVLSCEILFSCDVFRKYNNYKMLMATCAIIFILFGHIQ